MTTSLPLVVDLDGTLVGENTLVKSFATLEISVWCRFPFWLLAGRAHAKHRLAETVTIAPEQLSYHGELLDYLRREKSAGRNLILATGAPAKIAHAVAEHVGIFSEVHSSDVSINLIGTVKARRLIARFGERGFHYVGDSKVDLPVWAKAAGALIVSHDDALVAKVARLTPVVRRFH